MSTKHIHTAADLVRFRASVRIECGDCGSARTMSGVELVGACGAGSLAAARARMKCGRCLNDYIDKILVPEHDDFTSAASRVIHIPVRNEIGVAEGDTVLVCSLLTQFDHFTAFEGFRMNFN